MFAVAAILLLALAGGVFQKLCEARFATTPIVGIGEIAREGAGGGERRSISAEGEVSPRPLGARPGDRHAASLLRDRSHCEGELARDQAAW